jgi:hypothetical protein
MKSSHHSITKTNLISETHPTKPCKQWTHKCQMTFEWSQIRSYKADIGPFWPVITVKVNVKHQLVALNNGSNAP